MKRLLLTLALLCLCGGAWAATYYVDCADGDDANDGLSVGAPKLTIWNITQSDGDVINVLGGTTCAEIVTIGANNVTFQTYGTGNATIDATGLDYGFTNTDYTGLSVNGFDVTAPTLAGFFVNCTVRNTSMTASFSNGTVSGVVGNGASIGNGGRWVCADVTFTNISVDGAYSDAFYCDDCDRAIIDGGTISGFADGDTAGDGIQIVDSDDFWIKNVTCTHPNTGTKSCITQTDVTATGGRIEQNTVSGGVTSGISCSAVGCVVSRNTISDVLGGISGTAAGINLSGSAIAVGNVVTNAGKCLFGITDGSTIAFYNNLCLETRVRGIDSNTANTVTMVAQNNIVSLIATATSSERVVAINSGVTETITNNIYPETGAAQWADTGSLYSTLALWQAAGQDTDSLAVDPNLLDNNHIPASSPALGAGVYVGHYVDHRGCPFKLPPSIGAYELCSGDQASARTAAATRTAR